MSSSTEVAKDVGAFATAPIGGILIGSSVAPATCSFEGAVVCENWFGSTMNGLVGEANPDLWGFVGGLHPGPRKHLCVPTPPNNRQALAACDDGPATCSQNEPPCLFLCEFAELGIELIQRLAQSLAADFTIGQPRRHVVRRHSSDAIRVDQNSRGRRACRRRRTAP